MKGLRHMKYKEKLSEQVWVSLKRNGKGKITLLNSKGRV